MDKSSIKLLLQTTNRARPTIQMAATRLAPMSPRSLNVDQACYRMSAKLWRSCISHALELRLKERRQQRVDLQQSLTRKLNSPDLAIDRAVTFLLVLSPNFRPLLQNLDAKLLAEWSDA